MTHSSRRGFLHRSVGLLVATFGLIAMTASPALAATTAESSGFPLIGWLSYIAVAGLGLMPVLLWMRMRSRLDTAEPTARLQPAARPQGDAPHPFA